MNVAERMYAQNIIRGRTKNDINCGKIKKEPCEVCGKKAQCHHNDYNTHTNISWLCKEHHDEWHRKNAECVIVNEELLKLAKVTYIEPQYNSENITIVHNIIPTLKGFDKKEVKNLKKSKTLRRHNTVFELLKQLLKENIGMAISTHTISELTHINYNAIRQALFRLTAKDPYIVKIEKGRTCFWYYDPRLCGQEAIIGNPDEEHSNSTQLKVEFEWIAKSLVRADERELQRRKLEPIMKEIEANIVTLQNMLQI